MGTVRYYVERKNVCKFVYVPIFIREIFLIAIVYHRDPYLNTLQQTENHLHQQQGLSKEIVQTDKDVSPVKQGEGGFAYAVSSNNCNNSECTSCLKYYIHVIYSRISRLLPEIFRKDSFFKNYWS